MDAAGVPVLADLDPDAVTAADLPVLVKASAGGGGRGMRVVRDLADLPAAVDSASAEALAAFGDATVFIEQYVERGRHVEIQVLADTHGTVWALGERECSIQRRHQKILEESPSPLVEATPGLRDRLLDAATTAARAIGYVGAGHGRAPRRRLRRQPRRAVLLPRDEHPAAGRAPGHRAAVRRRPRRRAARGRRRPPTRPEPPRPRGHAVEVRLYAEDPASGWAPRTGPVHRFEVPGVDAAFAVPDRSGDRPLLRLDSGVATGGAVSPHYDPMLAKLIAWAPTRADAVSRLAAALAGSRVHGVTTNRDLLVRLLRHDAFAAGDTDTGFVERHWLDRHDVSALPAPLAGPHAVRLSALAAALATAAARRRDARVLPRLPSGWRNVPAHPQRTAFTVGPGAGEEVVVEYRIGRDGLRADGFDDVGLVEATPERVVLDVAGVRRAFDVATYGRVNDDAATAVVCVDSRLGPVALVLQPRFPEVSAAVAAGSLLAPMPGTVVRLAAVAGQRVEAGEPLVWLDAMKMEHVLVAPAAGVVSAVAVEVGAQVEVGSVLAVVGVPAVTSGPQVEEEQQ